MTRRPIPIARAYAFLSVAILAFQACNTEPIYYREGHPPRDQIVRISESKFDSIMKDDTTRASLIVSYRVDWEIDSESFATGTYRLGFVHDPDRIEYNGGTPFSGQWIPRSRSILLGARKGTFFDTATSPGTRTFWPRFKVHLMKTIGGGDYLAVATDSIDLKDVKP